MFLSLASLSKEILIIDASGYVVPASILNCVLKAFSNHTSVSFVAMLPYDGDIIEAYQYIRNC